MQLYSVTMNYHSDLDLLKPCPGYISETLMCRKLILFRDIGFRLLLCHVAEI